jgi:DNA-directed RNA polymerase subunit RPC12/RpoP
VGWRVLNRSRLIDRESHRRILQRSYRSQRREHRRDVHVVHVVIARWIVGSLVAIAPSLAHAQALTLAGALAFARAHQPAIRAARATVDARRADTRVREGAWLSKLGATAQLFASTVNNTSGIDVGVPEVGLYRIVRYSTEIRRRRFISLRADCKHCGTKLNVDIPVELAKTERSFRCPHCHDEVPRPPTPVERPGVPPVEI